MLSAANVASDRHQVEDARLSLRSKTPKKLSLAQIVKNQTASPCSLSEFMGYLLCEEKRAEILQFYIWFCGYASRWSTLSPQDMLLSPPVRPTSRHGQEGSAPTVMPSSHRHGEGQRMEHILHMLDNSSVTDALNKIADQGRKRVISDPLNFSAPRPFSGTESSQLNTVCGQKNNVSVTPTEEEMRARCAQQPFREEVTQIMRHYLCGDAPRRLEISEQDLATCLDALKYTTHPSALLPAFAACEAILKAHSHPSFLRKSQRNANKPRLILISLVAALFSLLGFAVSLVLILSRAPEFCRVISLILWWPGFTVLITSMRGICLVLYIRNLRQLRPWEHDDDVEHNGSVAAEDKDDLSVSQVKTYICSDAHRHRRDRHARVSSYASDTTDSSRSVTISISSTTTAAAAAKDSTAAMQTFGGSNAPECQARWARWLRKPMAERMWDGRARVQSTAVRLLQDRTVLLAVCWAGAVSSLLTVGSLWVPAGDMF